VHDVLGEGGEEVAVEILSLELLAHAILGAEGAASPHALREGHDEDPHVKAAFLVGCEPLGGGHSLGLCAPVRRMRRGEREQAAEQR